jgi:hypothetical protein
MLKLSSLLRDITAETDGEWVPIAELCEPGSPEVAFKVRPATTPAYRIARDQLIQTWVRKYGKDPVPPEIADAAEGALVADHLLLGWRGIDQPYTRDGARAILVSREGLHVFGYVQQAVRQLSTVTAEHTEAQAKN